MSRQHNVSTKSFEKKKIFFRPYPPKAFGQAKHSHFSQGGVNWSKDPDQMNLEKIHLAFSKTPFGIQAKDIQ